MKVATKFPDEKKDEIKNSTIYYFVLYSLSILRILIDLIAGVLFKYYYNNKAKPLPPITDALLLESATSLAEKIRNQKVKSQDVVEAYIKRIKEVNSVLNAVVDSRFAEAIKEAESVDKLLRSNSVDLDEIAIKTPLLGVPFTAKESIAAKGFHHCAGLVVSKNNIANKDAVTIGLMKKAGAILLGATNTSELCMWWESVNNVYGRTRNPYDTCRTSGGSSGGEGSIISAAGSVIGVGSDIGGSIRIPCLFNGIFGHKPTHGLISNEGQLPVCEGNVINFLTIGPLCRYATDLLPVLKVLCQKNAELLKLNSPVDISQLHIYYMLDDGGFPLLNPVHYEIKTAMLNVVNYFKKTHGDRVKKVKLQDLYYSSLIWGHSVSVESLKTFAEILGNGEGPINVAWEFIKWIFGFSQYVLSSLVMCAAEKFLKVLPYSTSFIEFKNKSAKQQLQNLLGENGVLLYPTCSTVAPFHNQSLVQPLNIIYSSIFNILGLPVTQCPLGLNAEGIPLGIQIVGNVYEDRKTIAIAVELEKAFKGWISPTPINSIKMPPS